MAEFRNISRYLEQMQCQSVVKTINPQTTKFECQHFYVHFYHLYNGHLRNIENCERPLNAKRNKYLTQNEIKL